MLFFWSHFLFLLQGICGSRRHEEDFRFCAERMQTEKGHVRYKTQENAIGIANSASELTVSAPFLPEHQSTNISESRTWPLPELPGSYRFCVYWFQHAHIFMLSYGSTKNYTLSKDAAYSLYAPNISGEATEGGSRPLFNVSYAFDKGWQNRSLPSSSAYLFRFADSGKGRQERKPDPRSDVEEFRIAEAKLKDLEMATRLPRRGQSHSESPFVALQRLESALGAAEFQGQSKRFGEGALLRASVWKVPPHGPQELRVRSQLQEDQEVRGYEVTLPRIVFTEPAASRSGRRAGTARAVLMEVTSRALFQGRNASRILGGKVIGISVQNRSVHDLPKDQRVAVAFQHAPLPGNETAQCVFWDADATRVHLGTWNTAGCEMVPGEAPARTTCLCDHLTFFAVLMVHSPAIDAAHLGYLTAITYVGCIVSAAASFFTVIFFLCSRRKQRDHFVWVHMHLLCAIFLLDMSFLVAVPLAPTGGEASCKAGAALLHVAVLACLAWMGIEGYSLYQRVIEVFTSYVKHLVLKLCLVGWGFPIIIVSLIFAIDPSHYGPAPFKVYDSPGRYTDATICWITKPEINNFLNLGLLALVLLFNGLMLAAMVREILRLKHREQGWEYVVTLLGLSCVLGVPWGVAFFSFTSGTFQLVAVYLFTIINSLQGFLIFLWTLAKVWRARRKDSMQFSNSQSVRLQSSSTTI